MNNHASGEWISHVKKYPTLVEQLKNIQSLFIWDEEKLLSHYNIIILKPWRHSTATHSYLCYNTRIQASFISNEHPLPNSNRVFIFLVFSENDFFWSVAITCRLTEAWDIPHSDLPWFCCDKLKKTEKDTSFHIYSVNRMGIVLIWLFTEWMLLHPCLRSFSGCSFFCHISWS